MKTLPISIPQDDIAEFCRKHHVRRLSLYGSVLREDFGPDSDVDMLVEFEPGAAIGLLDLAGMEIDLGEMIERKVDLNTAGFLSKYFINDVLREAAPIYVAP